MCVKLRDGGGWIAEDSPLLHPTFFLEEAPTVRHEGGQRESKRRIETGVN